MRLTKFDGITNYDGKNIISEYKNILPLGDRFIDRPALVYNTEPAYQSNVVSYTYRAHCTLGNGATIILVSVSDYVSTAENQRYRHMYYYNNQLVSIGSTNLNVTSDSIPVPDAYNDNRFYFLGRVNGLPSNTLQLYSKQFDTQANPTQISLPSDFTNNFTWQLTLWAGALILYNTELNKFYRSQENPLSTVATPLWYPAFRGLNNPGRITKCLTYRNQLWIFFETAIERYSTTGVNISPIQLQQQSTLYYNSWYSEVVNGLLYIYSQGGKNNGIFVVDENNQITKISNVEIDRRIVNIVKITSISMLNKTVILFYTSFEFNEKTGFIYLDGRWSSFNFMTDAPAYQPSSYNSIGIITRNMGLARTLPEQYIDFRRTNGFGYFISRYMRETIPIDFMKRQVIGRISINLLIYKPNTSTILDTHRFYVKISNDRGFTYGYTKYITPQMTNQISLPITRRLGSAGNLILEIGTADDIAFNVNGIDINLI